MKKFNEYLSEKRACWAIKLIGWAIYNLCSDEWRVEVAKWGEEFMRAVVRSQRG